MSAKHVLAGLPADKLITAEELAKLLGFASQNDAYRRITALGIPHVSVGDSVRFRVSEVRGWLDGAATGGGLALDNGQADFLGYHEGEKPDGLMHDDPYLPSEMRRELKSAADRRVPVLSRWLETIEPDLPADIANSTEWKREVRRAESLPKGSPGVEVAREQILEEWAWQSLAFLSDYLPPSLRGAVRQFIQNPNGRTREDVLGAAFDHVDSLDEQGDEKLRRHLRVMLRHGHVPRIDTYATIVVHALAIARLSKGARAGFWREADPVHVLSRLIGAKPKTSLLQRMVETTRNAGVSA